MSIYPIQKISIILLLTKKSIPLAKYLDFINLFLKKLAAKLLEFSSINKYTSNLQIGS